MNGIGKKEFSLCDAYAARISAQRPFPAETLESLRAYYRVGLTYTSNALEGNSLTESETKVVIEDGLTVGGKPLRDVCEATGHARAFDYLQTLISNRRPLTEADILELHRLFYSQIDKEHAGVWRTVRVFLSGSRRVLPSPRDVPRLMAEFVAWMAENEARRHPIEFAALVHQKFVFIHPFVDGNGRVGRLLMNFALLRAGWTPAIIPPVCRADYIAALDRAGRRPADFVRFVRDRVCETQKELLRLLGLPTTLRDEGVKSGKDEGANEGVNDAAALLLSLIEAHPGLRTNQLAPLFGKSVKTIERHLRSLRSADKIVFRGAPKNGGYFAVSPSGDNSGK